MNNNQQEKARLFGAIIKALIIGFTIYFVFGKPIDFNFLNNEKTENKTEDVEVDYNENTEKDVKNNDEEVFTVVESMPVFEGCESLKEEEANQCTIQKIQAYTAKVDYPQIAIDNDIEGKVYIRFVVDAKGKVSEVKLLRGVNKILDNASLNHIKKMPKFAKPGFQKGKAVKVQYNIPIVFKLG